MQQLTQQKQKAITSGGNTNVPFVGLHKDHTDGSHDRPAVMANYRKDTIRDHRLFPQRG